VTTGHTSGDSDIAALAAAMVLCADVQRDDGGVVGGDDAGVGEGPAGVFRRGLGVRAGGLVVSLT